LWVLADRYRWDNSVQLSGVYSERPPDEPRFFHRNWFALLDSEFRVFVENSVALLLSVRGSLQQGNGSARIPGEPDNFSKYASWSYGIGLEYRLDTVLN
jgi:hypothetical protein